MFSSNPVLVSPPWQLQGQGWIFAFKSDKSSQSALSVRGQPPSGLHFLMFVDYQSSPVGPYKELLLIPGRYHVGNKRGYQISHIHVSTDESTMNGRAHWGIPKVTSDFIESAKGNQHHWRVKSKKGEILTADFSKKGFSIPVASKLLPYQLIQQMDEKIFQLKPTASGQMKWATLDNFESSMEGFKTLNGKKALIGMYAAPFKMKFPLAKIT
ncbi:MAG: hypothetical protein ACI8QD_001913 [Cyclobacteriaceae bacterium]|jgi:hypothetical protein